MSRFNAVGSMRLQPVGRSLHRQLRQSEDSLINKSARSKKPTPLFEAEVESHPDFVVIRLKGELDIAQVPRIESLRPPMDGMAPMILDLSGLTFIDVPAIRLLLRAKQVADQRGQTFVMNGASGAVRRLFELMGLQHVLADPDTPL